MTTGAPISQSGSVTPGHLLVVTTDNVAADAGPANNGSVTALGWLDDSPPNVGEVAFARVDFLPPVPPLVLRPASGVAMPAPGSSGYVSPTSTLLVAEDLTPPAFQHTRRSLAIAFRGFNDPHQLANSPLRMYYCVSTTVYLDCDVVPLTRFSPPSVVNVSAPAPAFDWGLLPGNDAARVHRVEMRNLDLPDGITVYALVSAVNDAGAFTTAVSLPMRIDSTAPSSTAVDGPVIDLLAAAYDADAGGAASNSSSSSSIIEHTQQCIIIGSSAFFLLVCVSFIFCSRERERERRERERERETTRTREREKVTHDVCACWGPTTHTERAERQRVERVSREDERPASL
jgi:hypothetical protein